ncbi:PucR family transcriptional regulator [Amycolatopsis deserti]|uniref:PucR family transcriptional regulator n=1 Tax=Amycolatopsis deserti TaxID=185696 RepID=A0ABQ3JAK2_9PSEU|nr:PucR family transcriptional regulator [Amycolatopsis deserti]GHF13963.1 PucR family transcriptional regulator [Amycolatopsis deserti]
MTTVKTLLEIPELRLRLRTGAGLLGREVSRIYVTELPDPSRYVSAGEVVLSGLLWWRQPGDAGPFVAALARAGVAALAASGADTGGIPPDVVQECARHRIPLLEVPADLSFAVITERVVLELAAARGREPSGARKRLLAAATEDISLPALLRQGAAELGAPCWVLSGTGRVVAGTAEPPGDLVAHVVPGREVTVHDGYALLPVGGTFAVPWVLAVGHPEPGELAGELAELVRLARARADQVRRMAARAAEPLLRALADGSPVADAFAASGLPEDTEIRVLLARAPDDDPDLAAEVLAELLADARPVVGVVGEDAYALVAGPGNWMRAAGEALARLDRLMSLSRFHLGSGGPASVDGLHGATQEARHAVELAARRGGRIELVAGEDIAVHQLLAAGAPDELRRSVRARVLGPLLAYDAAQGTDLVHTVRVYLECSSSPTAAARALHVHVNTLRYRIARASELLGVDLNDFITQVDVYLALLVTV